MTEGARPRVVLVDDHRMFRSGVRAELGESVDIVGEAEDVDSAVATVLATSPDVVLLDVHLPGGNGREVLRLIARGYAYKEVARELVISIKTVETHVSAVLRKLQLSNRHELAAWASDRRLV